MQHLEDRILTDYDENPTPKALQDQFFVNQPFYFPIDPVDAAAVGSLERAEIRLVLSCMDSPQIMSSWLQILRKKGRVRHSYCRVSLECKNQSISDTDSC